MADSRDRLKLLGLVDDKGGILQAVVDRHSILLGKLISELGLGNILYGIEDPAQKVQILLATATSTVTLTTSAQSITGDGDDSKVRLLLPTAGDWLVEATCDFRRDADPTPANMIGELYVNDSGSAESSVAISRHKTQNERATVGQRWKITSLVSNVPVELKVRMDGVGGNGRAHATHTRLTVIGGAGSADIRLSNHGTLEGLSDTGDHPYATLIDGSRAFTDDQSMGNHRITSLAAPTDDDDAARKIDLYTDADAIIAVPFVEYIPFGSEPITGQSYAP